MPYPALTSVNELLAPHRLSYVQEIVLVRS